MQTLLSETELAFKDSVTKLGRTMQIRNPRELDSTDHDHNWKRLSAAGLLELRMRSNGGEPVASGIEVMIASEALGSFLVPAPFLGVGVMATELLALAEADAALIDDVASGTRPISVLLSQDLLTMATSRTGSSALAIDCRGAQEALALTDEAEPHVVLVRLPDDGATQSAVDATRLVRRIDLTDQALEPERLGRALKEDDIARWSALVLVALAADAVGVMRGILSQAVDYSKDRIAFGSPIGTFQALQHLCADCYVDIEAAYSLVKYAAFAVDGLPLEDAIWAARTAKGYASRAVRTVTESCMQLFGGIGHTYDHIAHIYLRRGLLDRQLLGDDICQFELIGLHRLQRS